MTIERYLVTLKRLKFEYLRQDPESVISDKAFAQRMLNRAGLQRRDRHDVFYNAGGAYRSKAIEEVLRRRCARIHEEDAKKGPAPAKHFKKMLRPRTGGGGKQGGGYKHKQKGFRRKKTRGTRWAGEGSDE